MSSAGSVAQSACFGEVLMRFSTPHAKLFSQSDHLNMCIGGAECNVAINLASLGIPTKLITTLTNNLLGDYALKTLNQFNINIQEVTRSDKRMGSYYLEVGAPNLKSKITYDRESSAFSLNNASDYDWNSIFNDVNHFHVSGINLTISDSIAEATIKAIKQAHDNRLLVSFDCNYRPILWQDRIEEARKLTKSSLGYSELAFLTEKDIQLILNLPANDSTDQQARLDAYTILFQHFPNLKRLASTFRSYDKQGCLSYQGLLVDRQTHHLSKTFHIPISIDRIGTGDAFASGVIYGLKSNMKSQQVIEFATALATTKHSIEGDFAAIDKNTVFETMQMDCFNVER